MRGISATSDALSAGSGTGESVVAALRADAVDGKDAAQARTVARTASGVSWVGGCDEGWGWKSEG